MSTDIGDEPENEKRHDYEIEEEDEDILQIKFKATYSIIYKAEFKYKKNIQCSIIYKSHKNDLDLDIYLM